MDKIENVKFLEKQYIFYALKANQKKCFNKDYSVDIKIIKGINNANFVDYQSIVSNDFFKQTAQINALKEIKVKIYKKFTVIT